MRRFLFSIFLLAVSVGAFAQSAGKIDKMLPAGFIARGKDTAEAKQAAPVQWNDILRTNDQGRMRVALDDGSMLSIGAHSELRVVKHDTQSNQTLIEMLYGKARANVVPIRKNGGSFQVRTPTAVIGVLGTTVTVETTLVDKSLATPVTPVTAQDIQNLPGTRNISDLLQLTPGAMPDKSNPNNPTIADYTPVDGTIVGSLDHIVGVRSIDPEILKTVYLLPGQFTFVGRGQPPTDPQFHDDFYANPKPKMPKRPPLSSAGCGRFPAIASFETMSLALDKALEYEITGRGTSTGSVFDVHVKNMSGCPLNLQIPAGTVLKPTGYTGRLVKGILLGGGQPPLKDFQVMMAEGGFGEVPAQGAGGDLPVMYFLPPEAEETTLTLRGYCLELHKLAPHQKTKYKFADADDQKRLSAPNLKVMEMANKLFFTGEGRPPMASLDSLVQWSLWASREGLNDGKKFEEEYVGLVKRNHEAQNQKFDKKTKEQTEQTARTFWPYVQKVVAAAK